ncbi:UNVERIFIED_CONTAM: hypothetical protein GTU68_023828 [Idotea baltica]|nr:hypothetical protein [Idotea baltica]
MDSTALTARITAAPIVPVLTVPDVKYAAQLATVLKDAGLTAVEVTLRTSSALEVISEMKAAAPELTVGAGTIRSSADFDAALKAGSEFLVSPGLPPKLCAAARANGALLIPGVATPTEAMTRADEGFTMLKLFPAEVVGGQGMLKAMGGPMPDLSFMPTGGVTPDNLASYLSLPNVSCVGGTWLAKANHIEEGDWQGISDRCREALALVPG